MSKNVLVTTMTISKSLREGWYQYEDESGKIKKCKGYTSTEPGSKYFLSKYNIDKIIAIGTKETLFVEENNENNEMSELEKVKQMETARKNQEKVSLQKELERLQGGLKEPVYSAFELYKMFMAEYLLASETDETQDGEMMRPLEANVQRAKAEGNSSWIRFVPERKEILSKADDDGSSIRAVDNLGEIVEEIVNVRDREDQEVNLYLDVQGGLRTAFYVRHAVLDILGNQYGDQIKVKQLCGIEFNPKSNGPENPSKIVDETERYRILDLVSGMNAFIRYGKADDIRKYWDRMNRRQKDQAAGADSTTKLVNLMVKVDSAISLCDMDALEKTIKEMGKVFEAEERNEEREKNKPTATDPNAIFADNVFGILKTGIKRDYGELLDYGIEKTSQFYPALIEWCARKGFIQQALTLIEDKMPAVYLGEWNHDKKCFSGGLIELKLEDVWVEVKVKGKGKGKEKERRDLKEEDFFENIGVPYEKRKSNKLFSARLVVNNIAEKKGTKIMSLIDGSNDGSNDGLIAQLKHNSTLSNVEDILSAKQQYLVKLGENPKPDECEKFILMYWEFRRMESAYEGSIGVENPIEKMEEEIYDRKFFREIPILFCCSGIVKCNAKKKIEILSDDGKKNYVAPKARLKFSIPCEENKDRVENLVLLHDALKKERNCCNHAAQDGIRLPLEVVKKAIEIYAKEARELLKAAEARRTVRNSREETYG